MAINYAEDTLIRGPDGQMVGAEDNALLHSPRSRFQQAVREGRAFNWASVTYDPAAGDTILGVENNDSNQDLHIYKIWITSDTASSCVVFTASGVTIAGTNAVTGVNLNRNYNTVALATAIDDETGQGEAATSWATRVYGFYAQANTTECLGVDGHIVLPNDHMIGVDLIANAGAATVTIWGWYE